MKLSTYATISAIVAFAYAIALLLFPVQFIEKYGVTLDAASTVITRFFGSAMFAFAILYWINRKIPASDRSWSGLLWSGVFLNVVNCTITVMAITKGIGNSLGWSTVAVNAIFALASLYFISTGKRKLAV
jgi:hypothetical protein